MTEINRKTILKNQKKEINSKTQCLVVLVDTVVQ